MARIQWFATSQFPVRETKAPGRSTALEKGALVHAKKLGTAMSACGMNTMTWIKFWEPFNAVRAAATCPACAQAIAESRASELQPAERRLSKSCRAGSANVVSDDGIDARP